MLCRNEFSVLCVWLVAPEGTALRFRDSGGLGLLETESKRMRNGGCPKRTLCYTIQF